MFSVFENENQELSIRIIIAQLTKLFSAKSKKIVFKNL